MNSLEKLAKLRETVDGPPGPDADVTELALRTAAMASRHLFDFMPDDPAELDRWLAQGAAWLLEQRSDDAPPVTVTAGVGQFPGDDERTRPAELEPGA